MGDESLEEQFKKLKFLVELSAHKNQNSNLSFDTLVQMDESDGISPSEPISDTVEKQLEVEDAVQKIYDDVLSKGSEHFPALNRKGHLIYTNIFLHKPLPSQMTVLDASHCWILYWLINATSLLGGVQSIDQSRQSNIQLPAQKIKHELLFHAEKNTRKLCNARCLFKASMTTLLFDTR